MRRHVGPRVALLGVALLALAATYGRVPGLALGAALPFAALTSNLLGAEVALGGVGRGALLPEPPTALRDRRLAVWALATGVAAAAGAAGGLALPPPPSVGRPPAGAAAAPAALVYAAALVPWFGRASWWWAVRYPQPAWRGTPQPGGAPVAASPAGPAHHQLALLGCWAAAAVAPALLWAATGAVATSVVHHVPNAWAPDPRGRSAGAWLGGVLLAAGVAAGPTAWRAMRARPGPNRT